MAHFLLLLFQQNNITVSGIYARDEAAGRALAGAFHTRFYSNLATIPDEPDSALFLCVPDSAITAVAQEIPFRNKQILVHNSGSTNIAKLSAYASGFACLWPMVSVSKSNSEYATDTPLCLAGSNAEVNAVILDLAKRISTRAIVCTEEQRQTLHLSAVMAQNFANHLFVLASELCEQKGLDAQVLQPMLLQWAKGLRPDKAKERQTGPARRNDENTLAMQRELLASHPELLKVYDTLTASIRKMYG
jgi:predicted short-subunit dehydrogenase-like oxidoreductase (DUF2520 family)